MTSYRHRRLIEQPKQMGDRKETKEDARDTQSSSLRVHDPILVIVSRFVSKNTILYLAPSQRCCLDEYTDDGKPDEHNGRARRRKHNCALNQVRPDQGGDNDQRPIKQHEQENRADNSTDEKDDS